MLQTYRLLTAGILFFSIAGLACSSHVLPAVSVDMPTNVNPQVADQETPVGMLPTEKRSVMASLRRTACFGSCPVFFVEIWSDGEVNWHGERYVQRLGEYIAQVSGDWIAEVLQEGEGIGYFDLAKQYPVKGQLVPDLPATITTLRHGRREHRILDNADSPVALQHFEQNLQEKLEMLSWKQVEK